MALFSRARRTRTAKMTSRQVKDQFIRELTSEANNVIRQMTQQFARELQSHSNTASGGPSGSPFDAAAQVIAAASTPLTNNMRTRTETIDSARSQEADTRFRLSQTQALAEANLAISKGDKNL